MILDTQILSQFRPLGWMIEQTMLKWYISSQLKRNRLTVKAMLENRTGTTKTDPSD